MSVLVAFHDTCLELAIKRRFREFGSTNVAHGILKHIDTDETPMSQGG